LEETLIQVVASFLNLTNEVSDSISGANNTRSSANTTTGLTRSGCSGLRRLQS